MAPDQPTDCAPREHTHTYTRSPGVIRKTACDRPITQVVTQPSDRAGDVAFIGRQQEQRHVWITPSTFVNALALYHHYHPIASLN